jgi:hypothetical protein
MEASKIGAHDPIIPVVPKNDYDKGQKKGAGKGYGQKDWDAKKVESKDVACPRAVNGKPCL